MLNFYHRPKTINYIHRINKNGKLQSLVALKSRRRTIPAKMFAVVMEILKPCPTGKGMTN